MPLVTLSAALAAQLTGEKFLGALAGRPGVSFSTWRCPLLLLLGIAVAGLARLASGSRRLRVCAVLGALLIHCRQCVLSRRHQLAALLAAAAEFAASLVLLPLACSPVWRWPRVSQQYGWTDERIFAAAGCC
jgi:hypothetical protein